VAAAGAWVHLLADVLAAVRARAVLVMAEAVRWRLAATASGIRLAELAAAARREQREVLAVRLVAQEAAREIRRTPMARGIRLAVLAAVALRAEYRARPGRSARELVRA
jgi:hypothetical protein